MLEKVETELANKNVGAAEKQRLQQRAEFVRRLLKPNPDPARPA
jgi:hypothetical protein